ncbi:MAG: tRNA (N6-isopentenyl adenosine(37)-C2)-methylthiotransferase MiaB [Clostridiales bacterium]|nr:tRNA (N6-isopentenyl adenosine(37)-C2)-methylthiotransferase MiaB [Clostridiales bacterium]
MKYFIQTFGCQMNDSDSNLMDASLSQAGYSRATAAEKADIIVVNTCCVRQTAENRAFGYIGSLKCLKEQKPHLIIAVCGCLVQKEGSLAGFLNRYRHVSLLLGTFAFARLPEYIEDYRSRGEVIIDVAEDYEAHPYSYLPALSPVNNYRSQISIILGCNNYCSYCIVPYVRGRERSRKPWQILEEAQALVRAGVKEVQLLGQNVNAYGKDIVDLNWDFARLLHELDKTAGIERIRYMTSHPRDFSLKLIETIAAAQHICHHFHLPLQSGCDKILSAMNRGYDTAYYAQLLENIRSHMPQATITSDLIVGFPGETEEDFQQTLDFLAVCQFDTAYTFLYSQRSGTPAATLPLQVAAEVKKERIQRLMSVQNHISLAQNQQLIGAKQEIMVEGASKNNPMRWSGRTRGNKIVVFDYKAGKNIQAGDLLMLRITAAQTWNLSGEII